MNFQSVNDLKEVISTNDATITGILIAVVITFAITIVYLYKQVQALNKEHMEELRRFNETLIKVNNSYNDFVTNMVALKKE